MKTTTTFGMVIVMLMSVISLTTTAQVRGGWNPEEPIAFEERGVLFLVFHDGTFDFNAHPVVQSSVHYRGNSAFAHPNMAIRIDQDAFGRVRRVGNVFINYDAFDRVSRIGSVFIRYNRWGLAQVGGLHLIYNRRGLCVDYHGLVRPGGHIWVQPHYVADLGYYNNPPHGNSGWHFRRGRNAN